MVASTFYKLEASGNDFILFDGRKEAINLSPQQIPQLCDRHFGIGGDQLLLLNTNEQGAFYLSSFTTAMGVKQNSVATPCAPSVITFLLIRLKRLCIFS